MAWRAVVGGLPLLLLLGSGCRRSAQAVPLSVLAANQGSYQGQAVVVHGAIVTFTDASGQYFVIQDAHQDRVEIVPSTRIAPYAGRRVTVEGTFHTDESAGRWIQLGSVSPAIRPTAHSAALEREQAGE
ncbi:MAG: hypothetical protein ACRDJU_11635, partial [Actinomycetota bacterium]